MSTLCSVDVLSVDLPKITLIISVFYSCQTPLFDQLLIKVLPSQMNFYVLQLARRLSAKFWPDCAIPDTSIKFGTVVDHG